MKNRGSATIEATIILPAILLVLFSLIFFSMYIYQRLIVLDSAIYTAKERAATWDNSKKELETGSLGGAIYTDGLYWRIFDDNAGSALVYQKDESAGNFIEGRLGQGLYKSRNPRRATVSYDNKIIKRTVSVVVNQDIFFPHRWLTALSGTATAAGARSDVSEPVELIRNFDLGNEYLSQVLNSLGIFGRGTPPAEDDSRVIASAKSDVNGQKVYHYPGCWHISKIKDENLVEFNSVDAADAQGFHLCRDCAKRKLNR